ncbi:MAG: LPS export ABC transporter periplasmic protein LptC [Spirochaetes bacterium]|nr:LPS export ABC transporter periplasmic protein LptC [Spirochaetota bacterium]
MFVSAFLTRCEMPLPSQSFRPDMLINNYKTTSYKNGNIEWILTADKASYFYDEKRTIATNIILNYFKEDKETAEVKADQAIIYTDSMDIDLTGNVDMLSTTGNRLLTEKITWNNKTGYLDNNEPIRILRKNGDIIEGEGLRADYNLESYEIKKSIKAITSNIDKNFK